MIRRLCAGKDSGKKGTDKVSRKQKAGNWTKTWVRGREKVAEDHRWWWWGDWRASTVPKVDCRGPAMSSAFPTPHPHFLGGLVTFQMILCLLFFPPSQSPVSIPLCPGLGLLPLFYVLTPQCGRGRGGCMLRNIWRSPIPAPHLHLYAWSAIPTIQTDLSWNSSLLKSISSFSPK